MVRENFTPIGSFAGIYILIIAEDLFYIGRSKNIQKRVTEHIRLLRNNIHYNSIIQNYYNTYKNLEAFCIEKCEHDEEILIATEQYYLNKLKPTLNISKSAFTPQLSIEEVNLKQGGERNSQAKINIDTAIKIVRLRNLGKTVKSISQELNVSEGICWGICSRGRWRTELEKYIPNEIKTLEENKTIVSEINKKNNKPTNRLFNSEQLLDILNKILSRKYTILEIASIYNTSKTVISDIKNYKVYKTDISNLLGKEKLKEFLEIPKGRLKC